MRSVTPAIDECVLEEVRTYAAKRNTSVNALVRDYLKAVAEQEDKGTRARRRLRELMEQTTLEAGPRTWSRDELHDR